MIEIEKKLNPSNESVELVKKDTIFVTHKIMNDILYDYEDLSLIKNDVWLRKRNGKFDLKVSKDKDRKTRFLDVYDEIEDESKICEILNVVSIKDANFIEIASLTTKREKYKFGEFNIDLDIVTSAADDFVYNLLEVELMVESESDIPIACEKMKKFMDEYDIADKSANAKIIQYFYEKKRHIFDALQQ
ncbi:MAG: CYTH domain-containing protein [Holosporaceae bacterium]|nr:CYTH domain-containing protein [Holosporaceae bacterium]